LRPLMMFDVVYAMLRIMRGMVSVCTGPLLRLVERLFELRLFLGGYVPRRLRPLLCRMFDGMVCGFADDRINHGSVSRLELCSTPSRGNAGHRKSVQSRVSRIAFASPTA